MRIEGVARTGNPMRIEDLTKIIPDLNREPIKPALPSSEPEDLQNEVKHHKTDIRGNTTPQTIKEPEDQPVEEPKILDTKILGKQVNQANALAESLDRGINFFVDEASGLSAVKVVHNATDEVIRTIPPEEFLHFVANVKKVTGLFFDNLV